MKIDEDMFRPKWYWRDGTPALPKCRTGSPKWNAAMHKINEKLKDRKYKVVQQDALPWGGRISTVWLGLDHRMFSPHQGLPPLIFETMVFPKEGFEDLDMDRYSTEEEALRGHKKMMEKWKTDARI